jgi:hypothetical protein
MKYFSDSVLSFNLKVGNGYRRIRFIPMTRNGSYYIPKDKEESKALESMDCFGSRFIKIESDPVPDKESRAKDLTSVGEIRSFQEAIDYLEKTFGSDISGLISPESIQREARKNGVVFPNMG